MTMFRPSLPPPPTSQGISAFSSRTGFSRPQLSGPQFSGSGTLLTDHCATAQYTLIDYGPTASYVPFIGCIDSQPECCPFTPVTTAQGIPVTSRGVYPRPDDPKDAIVNICPTDYYSISGSCCPSAYTPWTAPLGGITPCYSTLPPNTTPLPPGDNTIVPRATRPTVTVTGTVFAMQYSVLDDGAPVSPGGIAGVLVGCAVFAGALYWGVRWFHHRRRRAREFESMKAELHSPIGADPGSSVVPTSRYAPFDDISLVEKSEEVREAQLRRYSGLKPMATGSSRGQQPKLVHTRSQGAFSICRTPVEMYGKVEPPWGIPRGHGQSFRNPKDDTTIRAPIWHAMSTRSPESAGTSNNVHRQFHGVPELCTPVPLYRQPAMIDRPRAAYQYRRDDLTKGHRI